MQAENIKTLEDLETWLNDLPERVGEDRASEIAVTIAYRAAMRVLPFWLDATRDVDLTRMPNFRGLLISGVATKCRTPEIRAAARAARAARDATRDALDALDALATRAATLAARAALATTLAATRDALDATLAAALATTLAATRDATLAATRDATLAALDAKNLEGGADLTKAGLWQDGENPLQSLWDREREHLAQNPLWAFWIDWYDRALDGRPMAPDLVREIAEQEPEFWDGSDDQVNQRIADLVQAHEQEKSDQRIAEIFRSSIFDYTLDQVRAVMVAVPFPEDWKHLTDPAALKRFHDGLDDFTETLVLLTAMFKAEGTAMQGAGVASFLLSRVRDELGQSVEKGALRVGKLVEWGDLLERISLREDTLAEFNVLADPFSAAVRKLKELLANHFSASLARFTNLRDLELEPDAEPWEVLQGIRDVLREVRSGGNGKRPPLDAPDVAVLDEVLDSIERMQREYEVSNSAQSKSSLRREINFQIAKVLASAGLYAERVQEKGGVEKVAGEQIDRALKWKTRGGGLAALAAIISGWLNG